MCIWLADCEGGKSFNPPSAPRTSQTNTGLHKNALLFFLSRFVSHIAIIYAIIHQYTGDLSINLMLFIAFVHILFCCTHQQRTICIVISHYVDIYH